MADNKISSSPFVAIDSQGIEQKIKFAVLDSETPETRELAGYAFVDATGSFYDIQSSSLNNLNNISHSLTELGTILTASHKAQQDVQETIEISNSFLQDLSSSLLNIVNIDNDILNINSDLSKSVVDVSSSVGYATQFTEQSFRFKRATHIYSKNFNKDNLYDSLNENIPLKIDLHSNPDLNPAAINSTYALENYISKAIEVFIQNSTNKNVYVKVSYDPSINVSSTDYTVKIQPGVIYNSESKIAHMRHKICMEEGTYEDLVGELCTSIIYNTSLNHDLSVGATFMGEAIVTSVVTNLFVIPFPENNQIISTLASEWKFTNTSGYDSFKVSGQARISEPGQKLTIYISNTQDNQKLNNQYVEITSTTPETFDLSFPGIYDPSNPPVASDNYELIVEASGSGDIGDARILFADLIKYTS